MKIEFEIKDNKAIFKYSIGESRHESSQSVCPQTLIAFTNCLELACRAYNQESDRIMDKLKRQAVIEEYEKEKSE